MRPVDRKIQTFFGLFLDLFFGTDLLMWSDRPAGAGDAAKNSQRLSPYFEPPEGGAMFGR